MRLILPQFVAVLALGIMLNDASATCPASLKAVFIGNSYTGGRSIGKVCPDCQDKALPGNVRAFFQDPLEPYPGALDFPPPINFNFFDSGSAYHPLNNPHLGDVPNKIKRLADSICGDNAFEYTQNTQSSMTTRTHANQANSNPQNGTIKLLEGDNGVPGYDVVIIQPQSTEYLGGATDTRVLALAELMKRRSAAPAARFLLQQTWPRRDATTYNQVCTTRGKNKKTGMLQEIDDTIQALSQDSRILSPFQVAPTGSAFVQFAQLACPGILPTDECAFDTSVDCPIWFGENGKVSLYNETVGEGSHQSEEIGAWLSATVLYGMVQSDTPCYVSEAHLAAVMPAVSNLADYPSKGTLSIADLISEAAKLALEERYGTLMACTSLTGSTTTTTTTTTTTKEETTTSTTTPEETTTTTTTNTDPPTTSANCGLQGLDCCSGDTCTDGSRCNKKGKCR